MPQNKPGKGDQGRADAKPDSAVLQTMGPPVPAPIEGAKAEVVYYEPQADQDIPKNWFARFLYRRSQVVLSVLTFGILIFYAVQWFEFRSTREIENRAYVSTKSAEMVADPTAGINWIVFTCINTGRTPGLNGNIVSQTELRETSPPETTVVNPPEKASSKILFGCQIEVVRTAGAMKRDVPAQTQEGSAQGTGANKAQAQIVPAPNPAPTPPPIMVPQGNEGKLWYVYGIVTYEDVFGRSHQTKFCYRNVPGTGVWWFCPTYNEAN